MLRFFTLVVIFVIPFILAAPEIDSNSSSGLDVLYKKLIKKQESVKNSRLIDFISKGAPSGVDAPIPSIAEYETFKSDKSVNFLSDGAGHIVFRQFRRIRISDLLGSQMKTRPGLRL
ncbi:Neuropeptide-Like Protein [Caenorhabditis elegans]|uniref:Neuropeptide-Like Protein n=1 Tax=Caenorhabditis elegans TaxID=6239 RepID=Q8I118_CAEEL|nr:Neuropeptide-Like Protein [Caenorhabditis elegans]CAD59143.1 Neuropeptide-Like Protein [Caenorhabditis elegans]|eukprot:NP_871958.1 Uncharacterized protein CELE_F46C5.10 [Caenorhabditis elegans]